MIYYTYVYPCSYIDVLWLKSAIVTWVIWKLRILLVGIGELVLNVGTSAELHDVIGSVVRLKKASVNFLFQVGLEQ